MEGRQKCGITWIKLPITLNHGLKLLRQIYEVILNDSIECKILPNLFKVLQWFAAQYSYKWFYFILNIISKLLQTAKFISSSEIHTKYLIYKRYYTFSVDKI